MTGAIDLLGADLPLATLQRLITRPVSMGTVISSLRVAYDLDLRGDRVAATRLLADVVRDDRAPSRVKLWAARSLIGWGHALPIQVSLDVMGVVVHIDDVSVLAAYRDGSLRYIQNNVPLIVYDGGNVICDQGISLVMAIADFMAQTPLEVEELGPKQVELLRLRQTINATQQSGAKGLVITLSKIIQILLNIRGKGQHRLFNFRHSEGLASVETRAQP